MIYDGLIKRLRVSCESCTLWDGFKCCLLVECSAQKSLQAADAIEELQKITTHYEEESKGWWLAACDAKEERERLKEQIPKWIPVTERLPEKIGYYLTHIANINQMSMATDVVALWDGNHFYVSSFVAVTHWMPLPQPPESEGKLWES